jgi:hypothetical protein
VIQFTLLLTKLTKQSTSLRKALSLANWSLATRAVRGKLKEKLSGPQSDLIGSERPDTSTMEVSYIVLSRSRRPDFSLPFFSRVSLRAAANKLRGLGYRFSLTKGYGWTAIERTQTMTKYNGGGVQTLALPERTRRDFGRMA